MVGLFDIFTGGPPLARSHRGTHEIMRLLLETADGAGWGWRGVAFGKL